MKKGIVGVGGSSSTSAVDDLKALLNAQVANMSSRVNSLVVSESLKQQPEASQTRRASVPLERDIVQNVSPQSCSRDSLDIAAAHFEKSSRKRRSWPGGRAECGRDVTEYFRASVASSKTCRFDGDHELEALREKVDSGEMPLSTALAQIAKVLRQRKKKTSQQSCRAQRQQPQQLPDQALQVQQQNEQPAQSELHDLAGFQSDSTPSKPRDEQALRCRRGAPPPFPIKRFGGPLASAFCEDGASVGPPSDTGNFQQEQRYCQECEASSQRVRALAQCLNGLATSIIRWCADRHLTEKHWFTELVLQYVRPCAAVDADLEALRSNLESMCSVVACGLTSMEDAASSATANAVPGSDCVESGNATDSDARIVREDENGAVIQNISSVDVAEDQEEVDGKADGDGLPQGQRAGSECPSVCLARSGCQSSDALNEVNDPLDRVCRNSYARPTGPSAQDSLPAACDLIPDTRRTGDSEVGQLEKSANSANGRASAGQSGGPASAARRKAFLADAEPDAEPAADTMGTFRSASLAAASGVVQCSDVNSAVDLSGTRSGAASGALLPEVEVGSDSQAEKLRFQELADIAESLLLQNCMLSPDPDPVMQEAEQQFLKCCTTAGELVAPGMTDDSRKITSVVSRRGIAELDASASHVAKADDSECPRVDTGRVDIGDIPWPRLQLPSNESSGDEGGHDCVQEDEGSSCAMDSIQVPASSGLDSSQWLTSEHPRFQFLVNTDETAQEHVTDDRSQLVRGPEWASRGQMGDVAHKPEHVDSRACGTFAEPSEAFLDDVHSDEHDKDALGTVKSCAQAVRADQPESEIGCDITVRDASQRETRNATDSFGASVVNVQCRQHVGSEFAQAAMQQLNCSATSHMDRHSPRTITRNIVSRRASDVQRSMSDEQINSNHCEEAACSEDVVGLRPSRFSASTARVEVRARGRRTNGSDDDLHVASVDVYRQFGANRETSQSSDSDVPCEDFASHPAQTQHFGRLVPVLARSEPRQLCEPVPERLPETATRADDQRAGSTVIDCTGKPSSTGYVVAKQLSDTSRWRKEPRACNKCNIETEQLGTNAGSPTSDIQRNLRPSRELEKHFEQSMGRVDVLPEHHPCESRQEKACASESGGPIVQHFRASASSNSTQLQGEDQCHQPAVCSLLRNRESKETSCGESMRDIGRELPMQTQRPVARRPKSIDPARSVRPAASKQGAAVSYAQQGSSHHPCKRNESNARSSSPTLQVSSLGDETLVPQASKMSRAKLHPPGVEGSERFVQATPRKQFAARTICERSASVQRGSSGSVNRSIGEPSDSGQCSGALVLHEQSNAESTVSVGFPFGTTPASAEQRNAASHAELPGQGIEVSVGFPFGTTPASAEQRNAASHAELPGQGIELTPGSLAGNLVYRRFGNLRNETAQGTHQRRNSGTILFSRQR